MGTETAIALGAVSIISTIGSTALSYYSSQSEADANDSLAEYNYAIAKNQAEYNKAINEYNYKIEAAQADIDYQTAETQRQAELANASIAEDEAARVEREARAEAQRTREENETALSKQRAAYAASGVTSEGTPLLVMSENAANLELAVADSIYEARVNQNSYYNQASNYKYLASLYEMEKQTASYEKSSAEWGLSMVGNAYDLDMANAEADLIAEYNQSDSTRTSSYASLLSGVTDVASTGSKLATIK